ncbi:serine/threonine-protein kinase [Streptomyces sp. NBC_01187]|uniref:serine/threonine-protein kinase n=1 Tax=Streptomyces sp. NBC_01187 TaxID=2903766 RepID=UPI00386A2752|nr:protein kinase [Streptomyces sp. NBC_01187]
MNGNPSWGGPRADDGVAASAPDLPPPTLPALPDGYRAQRVLGTGRHSTTVLCREESSARDLVVKVLLPVVQDGARRLAAHSELLAAGAAAKHPCAVTVEDAGFTGAGQLYLIERLCPGGSAAARLAASGAMSVEDVLVAGIRLALALHSSHLAGVLHLDVRPANILYDDGGGALLADHAVGRVLQRAAPDTGAVFDPAYTARELFGWEAPGPAADVYALGATLYALLAGEPAHAEAARRGPAAVYEQVLKGGVPRPERHDVPEPLLVLLHRMMAPHPEGRPPLTEVHRILRTLLPVSCASRVPDLQPEPEPETPPPGWDPADDALTEPPPETDEDPDSEEAVARRRRNRNRLVAASSALLLVGGAVLALFLVRAANTSEDAKAARDRPKGDQRSAHPLPKGQLPAFQAQRISVNRVGEQVQVAWSPPKKAQPVYGYAVAAQTPDGEPLKVKNTGADEPSVVFSTSAARPDTCYVVTSLVQTADGSVGLAAAETVCGGKKEQGGGSSPTPESPAPSG